MKLAILAVFNTNSRCLIRIRTSWGLIGSKNKKQGLEYVVTVGCTIMKITNGLVMPPVKKIKTDNCNATYWFGPFLTKRSLKIKASDFINDLSLEGVGSIDQSFFRGRRVEPLTS